MSDFWRKARPEPAREPERLHVQRGPLGRKEEKPCPIYGLKDGYEYRAHALYVAWTEGKLTAKEAQRRLWKLEKEYPGKRGT